MRRVVPSPLRPNLAARKAAGITIQKYVSQLAASLEPALDRDNSEGIHDLRVASRRLRAAIDAYRDLLPRKGIKALREEVRELFRATGSARDLEVQAARLRRFITAASTPPAVVAGLDELVEHLDSEWAAEAEDVRKAIEWFASRETARRLAWFVFGVTGVAPEGSLQ